MRTNNFFSIRGLFYSVKLPLSVAGIQVNIAMIVMGAAVVYYFYLSTILWIGLLIFGIACLTLCHLIEKSGIIPLWLLSVILFASAWVGQLYGHKVEGKNPSFFKDVQFLMLGPAWLMSFIYQK